MDELERALTYPRVQALRSRNSPTIAEHLAKLRRVSEFVQPEAGIPVVLQDPKDDPVLYTAVAGNVGFLCTPDRHFYTPSVLEFCKARGIRVMDDVHLIRELLLDQPGPRA